MTKRLAPIILLIYYAAGGSCGYCEEMPREVEDIFLKGIREAEARNSKNELDYIPALRMEAGSVGLFKNCSPNKVRIRYATYRETDPNSVVVKQVVDKDTMILEAFGQDIWVSGCTTEERVDGERFLLKVVFQYAGTKTYVTAGNSQRTIHAVKAVCSFPQGEKLEALRAKALEEVRKRAEEEAAVAAKEAEARRVKVVFILKDKRTLNATMVAQEGDNYTVQTDAGETVKFTKDDIVGKSVKAKP